MTTELPLQLENDLQARIRAAHHPRELVVDVMFALQAYFGYLSDAAVGHAARLLDLTPVEIEELATFYTFVFREPVGRFVIHICDSLVCWANGYESLRDHLCQRLGIELGETTPDGLFTVLPVCCIGYCDRSPAILVNRKVYGPLTPESLDQLLERLRNES